MGTLPGYAEWRYNLSIVRHKGHADIAVKDRESGAQTTHTEVQLARGEKPHRVPEASIDAMVRDVVRLADGRRPLGDPIGDAARAALAASQLRRMHAEARGGVVREALVDPLDYAAVLEHIADAAGALVDVAELGADMCETFEGFSLDVDERRGAELWGTARRQLDTVRTGARGAQKGATRTAATVADAIAYGFTCGDCVEGTCHWGGGNLPGGRAGEAARREAAGESCGCLRHEVSVRMRRAESGERGERPAAPVDPLAWADDQLAAAAAGGDVDMILEFGGGGIPLNVLLAAAGIDVGNPVGLEFRNALGLDPVGDVAEAGRIIGEWYGRHVDPAGGLIGRVAAWASGAGLVPVGQLADDLDAMFTAGGPETLRNLDDKIKNPPVVLARYDDDVAEQILTGWYPTDPRHRLEHDTWFVNRYGRPLPRYDWAGGPALGALDDAQLAQVARDVYGVLRRDLGDVDTLGSIADVGAALFDIPGFDGPLLVPADADLAMICIRLHVDVAFERETRPDDPVVVDDPPAPSGPPAAVLAKLAARGMVELDAGTLFGSDTLRLDPPASLGVPCGRPLNVCPEHGATLYVVGGTNGGPVAYTGCKRSGCMRTWPNDRLGTDCDQIATFSASAPEASPDGTYGPEVDVCRHHADQLIEWGWSVHVRRPAGHLSPLDALELDRELAERCRRAARRTSVVAAARALVVELGFAVRDIGDGTPSYEGVFPDVVLSVTGPRLEWHIELTFTHDPAIDVFVYSTGWSHGVEGSERLSWPAVAERLALVAGRELPAFVLAAREADGGVELAAEALAAHVDPVLGLDFTAALSGSPMDAAEVTFAGYGRQYAAAFRHDPSAFGLVFAGAWALDVDAVEVPTSWSTWPAFLAHLTKIAEGAADAID